MSPPLTTTAQPPPYAAAPALSLPNRMFWLLNYVSRRVLEALRLASRPSITLHPSPASLVSVDPSSGTKRVTNLKDIVAKCKSLVGSEAWFVPTLWLSRSVLLPPSSLPSFVRALLNNIHIPPSYHSGHAATIYCTLGNFTYDNVAYTRRSILLPDGGTLALDFTPPLSESDPIDSRPMLVVLHGLTGGSYESYIRDVMKKITKKEMKGEAEGEEGKAWRGCVVNFRGCAGAPVTSEKLYQ